MTDIDQQLMDSAKHFNQAGKQGWLVVKATYDNEKYKKISTYRRDGKASVTDLINYQNQEPQFFMNLPGAKLPGGPFVSIASDDTGEIFAIRSGFFQDTSLINSSFGPFVQSMHYIHSTDSDKEITGIKNKSFPINKKIIDISPQEIQAYIQPDSAVARLSSEQSGSDHFRGGKRTDPVKRNGDWADNQ